QLPELHLQRAARSGLWWDPEERVRRRYDHDARPLPDGLRATALRRRSGDRPHAVPARDGFRGARAVGGIGRTMSTETGTGKYEALLERCKGLAPIPTAVAYPCEESALAGAIEAGQKTLIEPFLVGPKAEIEKVARQAKLDLGKVQIVEASTAPQAAARAVELVGEGGGGGGGE